jgi:hypothetical protein
MKRLCWRSVARDQQGEARLREDRCRCCISGEGRLRGGRGAAVLQDAGAVCAMAVLHAHRVLHRCGLVCPCMVAGWLGFRRVRVRGSGLDHGLSRQTIAAGHRPCGKSRAAEQQGEQHHEMDQALHCVSRVRMHRREYRVQMRGRSVRHPASGWLALRSLVGA